MISKAHDYLPSLFIRKHKIKTETGKLLDFKTHPYQEDIFDDLTPDQVFMKAAQGPGLTTTMIIKQLVMVHNYNLESI